MFITTQFTPTPVTVLSPTGPNPPPTLPQQPPPAGLPDLPVELLARIAVELNPADFAHLKATSRRNRAILASPVVRARMEDRTLARAEHHLAALEKADQTPAQRLDALAAAVGYLHDVWSWLPTRPGLPKAIADLCAALPAAAAQAGSGPQMQQVVARLFAMRPTGLVQKTLWSDSLRTSVVSLGREAVKHAAPGTRVALLRHWIAAGRSGNEHELRDRRLLLSLIAVEIPAEERIEVVNELRHRERHHGHSFDFFIDRVLAGGMTDEQRYRACLPSRAQQLSIDPIIRLN